MRLRSMFGFRPSHKKFEYQPRYWDPEKEEKEKRRRSIQFQSIGKSKRKSQNRSILIYAAALFALVFMIFRLEACTRF